MMQPPPRQQQSVQDKAFQESHKRRAPCASSFLPVAASPQLPNQTFDRHWEPRGPMKCLGGDDDPLTVDLLDVVTVSGSAMMLMHFWTRFENERESYVGKEEELMSAFLNCFRIKCPDAIHPMLRSMATMDPLPPAVRVKLVALCCELGVEDVALALFNRFKGTVMPPAWYHALVRLATETQRACDFQLALAVCDEMVSMGLPHTPPLLRQLLHGCCRLAVIPLDIVFAIMDFRLRVNHNLELCLLNQFFGLVEVLPGTQTKRALEYIRQLNPMLLHTPIQCVAANRPTVEQTGCHDPDCVSVKYYVVDPFSAPLVEWMAQKNKAVGGAAMTCPIPANTYITFLYSSVRTLCDKMGQIGTDSLAKRAAVIKELLDICPHQCFICPLDAELHVRPPDTPLCFTHHDKLVSFMRGICATRSSNCTAQLVTRDQTLSQLAEKMGIPTVQSFPF